jgi:hypothetical protein
MHRAPIVLLLALVLLTLTGCASTHRLCQSGFVPINPPAPTAEHRP